MRSPAGRNESDAVARAVRSFERSKDAGEPIADEDRRFLAPRLGRDLSGIRIHSDPIAGEAARALDASAFTVGRHIGFPPGAYDRRTRQGRAVLAHEVAHAVQQGLAAPVDAAAVRAAPAPAGAEAEAMRFAAPVSAGLAPGLAPVSRIPPAVQCLGPDFGQSATSRRSAITSDLTSPLPPDPLVTYQVEYFGPEIMQSSRTISYRFEVRDRASGNVFRLINSASPNVQIRLPSGVGSYRIVCTILVDGATVDTVSIDQDVAARDPRVAALGPGGTSQDVAAQVELIESFRSYVNDAAVATGPNGITPLFLASLLRIEIANTPLLPIGSPRAAREQEAAGVEQAVAREARGETVPADDLDRSMGVGQIRPSTAAMVTGARPWVEQDPANRGPGRATTQQNYANLSPMAKRAVVARLRWPKSNITIAANLLARLKNRPNRYPSLGRGAFGTTARAVKIVATEYNLGPSSSPESAAAPSWYGDTVWTNMQDATMQQFFPNT